MTRVPRSLLSARGFYRDPVGYVRARGADDEVVVTAGPGRFALVRDPDAIWNVLVTDARSFRPGKWKRRARRFLGPTLNTLDGEEHRRRRMLLQPSLDRRRIAALGQTIAARAEEAQARLEDRSRIRLRDELDRYSLLAAADVLLSTDLEPHAGRLVDAVRTGMAGGPRLTPPARGTPHGRALAEVERLVDAILAERRAAPAGPGDLVDALLSGGLSGRTARGEVI